MKDKIISFETAKTAKEKGFPQDLFNCSWYNELGDYLGRTDLNRKGETFSHAYPDEPSFFGCAKTTEHKEEFKLERYISPTQSLLQRWLREVHNIDVVPLTVRFTGYLEIGYYTYAVRGIQPVKNYRFDSWEQALEVGLLEGLNLIK